MARTFKAPDPTPEDHPADWIAAIPACGRCGVLHWGEWLTRLDDGTWCGDPCLTPEEASKWVRVEEVPRGKIHAPVT